MSVRNTLVWAGVLSLLGAQAVAQTSDGSGISSTGERKAAPINMGGVFVTPTVDVLMGNNNNVTSASATQPKVSSSVVSVRPGIVADIERRGDKYQASYFGQYDRYSSSSTDNINNHDLRLTGQNYLSPRADVNWGLRYADVFDPRNATTFVTLTSPLHYKTTEAKLRAGYGAEGAPGRIEVYTGASQKRNQNGHPLTLAYDLDTVNLGATYYYRIAPKTRILADVSQTNFNYPNGNSTLSNVERKAMVGATWDLLAATSGTVKVGYFSKKPSNPTIRDQSGASLEGILNWKPLTYTELIATANRGASEASIGAPGFVLTSGGSLTWKHAWRSYVNSTISANKMRNEFTGTTRVDNITGLNASLMYDLTRTVGLGVEVGYTKRDSTDPLFTYDQRRIMFKVSASL